MREIHVDDIVSVVERLFIDANVNLSDNMYAAIRDAIEREGSPVGKEVLRELLRNADTAREEKMPICQDTGLAVTFLEIGQDVHVVGGDLTEAISEGVRRAYRNGYLRKSCCHPFSRKNTGDNSPAIIHTKIVAGDRIKITVLPKGGGSENYGEVRMLVPAQGKEGLRGLSSTWYKREGLIRVLPL